MYYLLILLLLFFLELLYFKIADHYNIIDKPNHRSSHSSITLRGGGIIFPIAVIIAFASGEVSWALTLGVVLVAVVSFIDDVKPLHQFPRFISHIIAIALILYDINTFSSDFLWLSVVVFVFGISWVNMFNFMDGINGITVLTTLVSIVTFGYLYRDDSSFTLLVIMAIACLVFGFFNVRKRAKAFAGDVGSISIAVFLIYFMTKTIYNTADIAYLLFFSVYLIDAGITICFRLINKENIFEAHRSHLYQYLANELKWSHIKVSVIYAIIQLIINVYTILAIESGDMSIVVFVASYVLLALVYLLLRYKVKKSLISIYEK